MASPSRAAQPAAARRPLRVAVVFGTRPEAIKLAPVILALRAHPEISCRVCVTAQHRHMLDQVLAIFHIVPEVDLDLMRPDQGLGALSAAAISGLDAWLAAERPDLVLVQGDTTTVFCTALAAFYHHTPVGHVEAGLRTGDLQAPWPEEANRVLTTRLATLHFAPTAGARRNLAGESVPAGRIVVTGNTVVDALGLVLERLRAAPGGSEAELPAALRERAGRPTVLITGHRRESFGAGFERICRAIAALARRFPHADFVYPVHLNPSVQEPVRRILGTGERSNVRLLEPLSYLPFVALMDRSTLILTDSGGIQEEAPSLAKPVLVMRDATERPEALEAGTARLVGTDTARIVEEVSRLLEDPAARAAMVRGESPFGDGQAARRIVEASLAHFGRGAWPDEWSPADRPR